MCSSVEASLKQTGPRDRHVASRGHDPCMAPLFDQEINGILELCLVKTSLKISVSLRVRFVERYFCRCATGSLCFLARHGACKEKHVQCKQKMKKNPAGLKNNCFLVAVDKD